MNGGAVSRYEAQQRLASGAKKAQQGPLVSLRLVALPEPHAEARVAT